VVLIAGSNTAECAPITTHYLWQCREKAAADRRDDPRMTPITRNADLYPAGAARHGPGALSGMLHVIVRDGLREGRVHRGAHDRVGSRARFGAGVDPERAAQVTGVPPENIVKAAHWIGETDRAMGMHARGIEHHSKGVENCLAMINLFLATGNFGAKGAGCMMITGPGQRAGRPRARPEGGPAAGRAVHHRPRGARHVAGVWGIDEKDLPGAGLSAVEIMEAIHRGEIKALLSMCFNPLVSLPDAQFTREALSKLEFFGVIDFFMSETAHYADVVFAGSLHEEDEGVICSAEGRVQKINKAVDPPGEAKSDALISATWRASSAKGSTSIFRPRARSTTSCGARRRAARRLLRHHLGARRAGMGVFWPCPSLDHPGTPGCSKAAGSITRTARRTSR
jgi:assimilatory nitrate reductase catalytic subunit